jgi:acetyl esterase/lipase
MKLDLAAPYDVEEFDAPFARPQGIELLARIYRPKTGASASWPVLVDVHGGAWNQGDRTVGSQHGRGLAACGLVVVSLDFRQGPDHQHPAASADIAAGIRWVRANALRLHLDVARVGISGSSSGGQLALLAAVKPGVPQHAGTPIVMPDGSLSTAPGNESVAYVLALYPVADPLARYRYVLTRKNEPVVPGGFNAQRLITSHVKFFGDESRMADASITRIVSSGEAKALPPLFLAHAELDDNVPSPITETFARAWKDAGGQVEHVYFPGARHGFIQRPGPDADKCIALMREFIGRKLAQG